MNNIPSPAVVKKTHDNRITTDGTRQKLVQKNPWMRLHFSELRVGDVIKFKPNGQHFFVATQAEVEPGNASGTGIEYSDGRKVVALPVSKATVFVWMKGRK